jgi:phospholipase C
MRTAVSMQSGTLVVISNDGSDGWHDHQMGPTVNQSGGSAHTLTGPGTCGSGDSALPGISLSSLHALGRCGYGPHLSLILVSLYAFPAEPLVLFPGPP